MKSTRNSRGEDSGQLEVTLEEYLERTNFHILTTP